MMHSKIEPNTFTIQLLIQSCNFKKRGDYSPALYAFCKIPECIDAVGSHCALKEALFEVCEAALQKASRWQDAMKVFVGLHELGMHRSLQATL